ncbi:MAG: DUF3309 family protein [Acidobacteriaceae bacterium]|nr:DUF3309 family protein [Acidobacteriaceae bacterium]
MLVLLIVILLLCGVGGGVWGHSAGYGYYGWSPLGLILIVLLVLALMGRF